MNVLQNILDFIRSLLSWWFIVEPWEQAVRVRFGKHVELFSAGVHFRIPFFDAIYKQNVRRRFSGVPLQTLTTNDGKSLTVHGSLGYRIADVLVLHQTLHDAEFSIQQEVLGLIAAYVVGNRLSECAPKDIIGAVSADLDLGKYGLTDVEFFLTGYIADIPTYRLLQDTMAPYYGTTLTTQSVAAVKP